MPGAPFPGNSKRSSRAGWPASRAASTPAAEAQQSQGGGSQPGVLDLVRSGQARRVRQLEQRRVRLRGVEGCAPLGGHLPDRVQRFTGSGGGQQRHARQRRSRLVAGDIAQARPQHRRVVERHVGEGHRRDPVQRLGPVREAAHARFHDRPLHPGAGKLQRGQPQRQIEKGRVRSVLPRPGDEGGAAVRVEFLPTDPDALLESFQMRTGKAPGHQPGGDQPGFQHGAGAALAVGADDPDALKRLIRRAELAQQRPRPLRSPRLALAGARVEPVVVGPLLSWFGLSPVSFWEVASPRHLRRTIRHSVGLGQRGRRPGGPARYTGRVTASSPSASVQGNFRSAWSWAAAAISTR